MRVSSIRLLPLALLTLLAALTFWLDQATRVGEQRDNGKGRHDPDFIVDQFTVRRYDIEGHLQHVLTASKMTHYPDDDSTDVTSPALSYFGHGQRTDISAPRAWLGPDGNELRLSDAVRVVQQGKASDAPTLLTTEEMRVYPDAETARSSTPVTIVQGGSVITGTGFTADNKTQVYTLQGRAHAQITKQKAAVQ